MARTGVSEVTSADWETIRELRVRALTDAPDAFASTLERERTLGEHEWRSRLALGGWFVARSRETAIGLAAAFTDPAAPTERHLVSMWVDPDHRGSTTASDLVEAICRWARGAGAAAVTLWVVDDNARARRLYERCGFRPTGRRQPLPRDATVIESEMRRELRPESASETTA